MSPVTTSYTSGGVPGTTISCSMVKARSFDSFTSARAGGATNQHEAAARTQVALTNLFMRYLSFSLWRSQQEIEVSAQFRNRLVERFYVAMRTRQHHASFHDGENELGQALA